MKRTHDSDDDDVSSAPLVEKEDAPSMRLADARNCTGDISVLFMIGRECDEGHYAMVYAPVDDLLDTYTTDNATVYDELLKHDMDSPSQLAIEYVLDEKYPEMELRFPRHEDKFDLREMMREWTFVLMPQGFNGATVWHVPKKHTVISIVHIYAWCTSEMTPDLVI